MTTGPGGESEADQSVLTHTAVMAAGTVVSRLSGFVRSAMLAAALGASVHADIYNVANSVPNMLYILLAGGIFNAVLVPQLIRSQRNDPDGGEAYTNRIVTVAGLFLLVVTVLLVLAAPLVVAVVLGDGYTGALNDSAVAFARYCLPQVFFYGMFVLVGQILNARGSFGPMMWAPITNNVIAVAVLTAYLLSYGPAEGEELRGPYSDGQEALLGLGSTLGIAVQLLVLLPYLRRAGFSFRPRFDLRGSGLGHTLRLGIWTVLFVVVNQIAYVVVMALGSGGVIEAEDGTGYSIYALTFLVVMVPHSVITVSLATAVLPRLSAYAAAGDLPRLAEGLTGTLRAALAVIVPFVALLPIIAGDLAEVVFGHGASAPYVDRYVPTLSLWGLGILFFTVHYLVLRGFYALELNRTVFFVQCAVAATNVVAAVVLVGVTDARHTSPALVLAYTASYVVASTTSYLVLRHRLGGLGTRRLAAFLGRILVATGVATGLTFPVAQVLGGLSEDPSWVVAAVRAAAVAAFDVVVFLVMARLLRISEVNAVVRTVTRRVQGRSSPRDRRDL